MGHPKFRWGIIGLGSIANKFASGIAAIPDAELLAVASRTQEKAEAFGDKYGAERRYGSYAEIVKDADVDAIYIATPHSGHEADTILCLEAGKPTLTEKPFSINHDQASRMVAASRANNVFLMEAMWSRFFPMMEQLRGLIKDGAIGDLRTVQADFGFRAGFNPESRLFNPALGGGGLLDVGVYTVSLASMLLGKPKDITGYANLSQSGVDEEAAMLIRYAEGQMALLSTAVRLNTPQEVMLVGTAGRIRIHSPWWIPRSMTITRDGQKEEIVDVPMVGNGYNYQADEVARCVREGLIESPIMPHDETLEVMKTLDTLRAQWGVKYPME